MAVKSDYLQWVLEQLSVAGPISTRRMFGAVGLYRGDTFFAIIDGDVLYFKANDANRMDYESRGAKPFRPFPDKPHASMSYYEVPADILEDSDECAVWVQRAVAAALASRAKMPTPRRKAAGKRASRARSA